VYNSKVVYITKNVAINEKAASEILLAFKCTTKIVGGKGKPVLSAILQRITFDMLISYTNKYFIKPPQPKPKHTQPVPPNQQSYPQQQPQYNSRNSISPIDDTYLEAEIVSQMSTLCKLIGRLAQTRKGSDEISRVAPIKVRQQIYSVLGSRGFCKDNHQTIDKMAKYIFENALKYRQFNSDEKHREFCYKAVDVVKKFVHLYFRLQAQEPVPEYSYFFEAGVPLQNSVMDGSWDDENMDNLEVEICSFPLISIKSKDNSRKILSKAV
ncbi:4025_t:CDS:1, partial [Scutellospora calospora]